jgi:hypothetical protein
MDDMVMKVITNLSTSKGKSLCTDEWQKVDSLWYFHDKLYVPNIPDLRRWIAEQHQNSKIAGHARHWKTIELVTRNYWWLHMSQYISEYCKSCNLCLRMKPQHCKPFGELHPLPIPENRWDVTSVDFIAEWPESHGYNVVMVVMDSTSKHSHFVPTHTTVMSAGCAQLYLQNVWTLHGLPLSVLSDHGPQFIALFMCELYRLLDVKIVASTAYHPQSDGQTKHLNQELEQYLHIFMNE